MPGSLRPFVPVRMFVTSAPGAVLDMGLLLEGDEKELVQGAKVRPAAVTVQLRCTPSSPARAVYFPSQSAKVVVGLGLLAPSRLRALAVREERFRSPP